MRLVSAVAIPLLFSATIAQAAPLTGPARAALAGEWRARIGSAENPCEVWGDPGDLTIRFEFAVTGGMIWMEDNTEASDHDMVESIDDSGGVLTLKLKDRGAWTFRHARDGVLVSGKPPQQFGQMQGAHFRHCVSAADRSAIRLNAAQTAAISTAMPNGPWLIDVRTPGGCKAVAYQYLSFDLVGPLGFELDRWNSTALGERIAGGGKAGPWVDALGTFIVDKADASPNGYRFTITEKIPPNGSRGDTTTITVVMNKNHTATIPEWNHTYLLCTEPVP